MQFVGIDKAYICATLYFVAYTSTLYHLSVSRFTSTIIKQGFLLTVESTAGTNIVAV